MEQKKYMSITRYGHKTTMNVLNVGDEIVIQEKIDGANASFTFDLESQQMKAFSRNRELHEGNTLGGFYGFVNETINGEQLLPNHIYFGEWLNPHKVKYPEYQKQFFLFDVYSIEEGLYKPFDLVKEEAARLGLNLVPVLFEGKFESFEQLQSYVGQTKLGGMLGDIPTGEGIVVKNASYINRHGAQIFVKLVTSAFREVQQQKAPKDPKTASAEQVFVNSCMTSARVEKILYKLVDEGVLDEQFGIEDMGTILKNISPRLYDDMMKEESDMLPEGFDDKQIRKAIARSVANVVKEILNAKQM
ncbi:hypothetical protein CON01_00820 [Bacillus thuringiensis]|uniref:RNA ligase domain-containing protein n=1 Tax=Bacillus thuringiensis TaxID=1428 RepID=A0A9X6U4N0_BACTU|nr:RNA ligase family protein [Bacillus thuringiensis]PED16424.1 hypothetical protein CON01_00820 [Bacillus thuringiensis]PGO85186.1 hypothetical protein CN990_21110 [Bacillus thuringiensis]